MTRADGGEVVTTLAGFTGPLPPLLILDRLEDYFDGAGLGSGSLEWRRIGDGQSNVTFRINRGRDSFVLRRGPRPPLPPSAHDMAREVRVLKALKPCDIPVPDVLALCDDEEVLGVPFYVMEWLDGCVITSDVPANLDSFSERRATVESMVAALVQLHGVDHSLPDIASLGRAEGYLERQIARFANLWEANGARDLPDVGRVADWLERTRPESQRTSVVHGDFRLGNLMYELTAPARPLAILDWEMATLGDPLSDLGYMVATYSDADSPWNPLHMSPVTARPGYPRRPELIDTYAEMSGLDVSNLGWYQVLALWKAAVFCEAIYSRWRRGERPGDQFGPTLEDGVPALLAEAMTLID